MGEFLADAIDELRKAANHAYAAYHHATSELGDDPTARYIRMLYFRLMDVVDDLEAKQKERKESTSSEGRDHHGTISDHRGMARQESGCAK